MKRGPTWFALLPWSPSSPKRLDEGTVASLQKTSARPVTQVTRKGVVFMSGGIGIGDREIMAKESPHYNLKLSFVGKSGAYLSGIRVVVKAENGSQIVSAMANGPWFFIKLTPGKYKIYATFEKTTRIIKEIAVGQDEFVFRILRWDVSPKREGERPAA